MNVPMIVYTVFRMGLTLPERRRSEEKISYFIESITSRSSQNKNSIVQIVHNRG